MTTGDQKTFTNEKTSLKEVALVSGCRNVIECQGNETRAYLEKALNDNENCYVIIAKVKSGNVPVKPIQLNPITIRDRFRKIIGKVKYLKLN